MTNTARWNVENKVREYFIEKIGELDHCSYQQASDLLDEILQWCIDILDKRLEMFN